MDYSAVVVYLVAVVSSILFSSHFYAYVTEVVWYHLCYMYSNC